MKFGLGLLGLAVIASGLTAGQVPARPDYSLVWADEFDKDGAPDPANWTYERGFVRNQELQWYQPDNARVEHGMLVIEARRERVINPAFDAASPDWKRNRPAAEYTSASVTTRGLHTFTYGRFEMRARIDTRSGMWPANPNPPLSSPPMMAFSSIIFGPTYLKPNGVSCTATP